MSFQQLITKCHDCEEVLYIRFPFNKRAMVDVNNGDIICPVCSKIRVARSKLYDRNGKKVPNKALHEFFI